MTGPMILTLDIESSPNLADVWGLWNVNVGLAQLKESQRTICWAAKWLDSEETLFASEYHNGYENMLRLLYDHVNMADIVITYNGVKYDMPMLQTEWVKQGWTPPAPWKDVDLLKVVKKQFRFPSNKLDYVAGVLLGDHKVDHEGHDLWNKVLMIPVTPEEAKVKDDAWSRMEEYNRGDVELTEQLYRTLFPWIHNHPNIQLYTDDNDDTLDRCPSCNSESTVREGFAYTNISKKQRYHCVDCGRWFTGKKAILLADTRGM